MKILKQQIQVIHAILPEAIKSDPSEKQSLIAQFTGDVNLTSTKDLTFIQANELIKSLNGKPVFSVNNVNHSYFKFTGANKQDRTILSLAHQYGWEIEKNGKYIADMTRLGEWLMNKAPVKKPLTKQTPKELSKTITALENMIYGKYKKPSCPHAKKTIVVLNTFAATETIAYKCTTCGELVKIIHQ